MCGGLSSAIQVVPDSGRLWVCHKNGHRRMQSRLSTMDVIHQCLSTAPVPFLYPAFSALRLIWSSIEQAQASKRQLQALAQSIAQLLRTLDRQCRAGRPLQDRTSTPLSDLCRYLHFLGPLQLIRAHHADYWPKFPHLFRRGSHADS
jgi:hypothetical protein